MQYLKAIWNVINFEEAEKRLVEASKVYSPPSRVYSPSSPRRARLGSPVYVPSLPRLSTSFPFPSFQIVD